MSDYSTDILPIIRLSNDTSLKIADLYLKYYEGSDKQQVYADLSTKREILLLYYGKEIVGFTTLQVYSYKWLNQDIRVVYSGDTIVEQAHWGQQALAFSWISRMAQIKAEDRTKPLYWFVIIKGHRTFKYLPTFGKSFYPHWSIDRSDLKPLADYLAKEKFGNAYNPQTGVVEFSESLGHLKQDIAYPTEEEMTKESVQYFLKKNPNYLQGHELVCLCELEEANMKPLTKRIYRKALNDCVMEAAI